MPEIETVAPQIETSSCGWVPVWVPMVLSQLVVALAGVAGSTTFTEPTALMARDLVIESCSVYVPEQTWMVDPGMAASMADWMVL
jgi:hypothetical protein